MSSLPESWDTVVAAIRSSWGSDKLKFDEIWDVVLSESIHKRETGDSSGNALSVDRRGRSKSKNSNKHGRSKSKNRGKSPNKPNVTCWSCGGKGHFWIDCTKLKKKQNHKSKDDDSIYTTEDTEDVLILSVDSPAESWIWDSGASFHSSSRNCFEISNQEILGRCILLTTKLWRLKGREMSPYKL